MPAFTPADCIGPVPMDPLTALLTQYPPTLPLYWAARKAYYTDGSHKVVAGLPCSGAAFYLTHQLPSSQTTFTVHPGGIGGTNTITRAELAGVYAALSHEAASHTRLTSLTVFCDSLACLYLEQTAQYSPHTLRECKHAPLLMHIRSLVLARAKLGYHTHFQKVPSHCGIVGNEMADKGAALALKTPPGACFSNLTFICPNYLSTLPAWPHLPPPHTPYTHPLVDPSHTSLWQAPDLNTTIKQHISRHCPDVADSASKDPSDTYTRIQASNAISLPIFSNYMWQSSLCRWSQIKKMLLIRAGTYWTASRARTCGMPYRTANGICTTGLCPICSFLSPGSTSRDTAGHILGECSHPKLAACYISRHNAAVCLIQSAIDHGDLGSCFTIMDATSLRNLPLGIHSTRLPRWLLPDVDPVTRNKLRPDILLIQGLSPASYSGKHNLLDACDCDTLAHLHSTCVIHLIEVGFTSDASHADSLYRKRSQHTFLVRLLLSAGWKVYSSLPAFAPPPPPLVQPRTGTQPFMIPLIGPASTMPPATVSLANDTQDLSHHVHIILISFTGVIYKPIEPILLLLGVSHSSLSTLLRTLHVKAVNSADFITRLRRALERSPSTFFSNSVVRSRRPAPPIDPP